MSTRTSVTGSTMLEPVVALAGASGPEAEGGISPPAPLPKVVAGTSDAPEFGTRGVTCVGTVVPGAMALCAGATGPRTVPADAEVELCSVAATSDAA